MKRILIFILCGLCVAFCYAQTTINEIPLKLSKDSYTIVVEDSMSSDSVFILTALERTFKRRINERIWQLTDIISYVYNGEESEQKKKYYTDIALGLFAKDANAVLYNKEGIYRELNIRDFFEQLSVDQSINYVRVDSLEVPLWNYALIKSDTLGIAYVGSRMQAIHAAKRFSEHCTMLPIVAQSTEDGTEWIPLFGRMIVTTFNPNDYDKKNNMHSIDAANDRQR